MTTKSYFNIKTLKDWLFEDYITLNKHGKEKVMEVQWTAIQSVAMATKNFIFEYKIIF